MKVNLMIMAVAGVIIFAGATVAKDVGTNATVAKPDSAFPAIGMSVTDLEKAIAEIRLLLPGGKDMNILSIWIHDPDRIEMRTGRQDAPLAGQGRSFEFRKIKGKWAKTSEGLWVS